MRARLLRHLLSITILPFTVTVLVPAWLARSTPVSLGGSATGLASTSWGTSTLTFSGAPTWTAGQEFLVKFKLHAKDSYQAHVGSMKLKYVRLTP